MQMYDPWWNVGRFCLAGVPRKAAASQPPARREGRGWQPCDRTGQVPGEPGNSEAFGAGTELVSCTSPGFLLACFHWKITKVHKDLDLLQKLPHHHHQPLMSPWLNLPAIKKAATQTTGFLVAKLCFYVNPATFSLEHNWDPPPLK